MGRGFGLSLYFMKPLLVIASGRCVWDDLEIVFPMLKQTGFDSIAVNHMIIHYPYRLTYAASWHFDYLHRAIQARIYRGLRNKPISYGPKEFEGVDNVQRFRGEVLTTSGMYAARVGLELGYEKIVLAGLPYDETGHFFDPPLDRKVKSSFTKFNYGGSSKKNWEKLRDKFDGKVKAVSGNLVNCFGEVTDEWLRQC